MVSVINLDHSSQQIAAITYLHRMHKFVMNHPGCRIAYLKLAFQHQRRQSCLFLADQLDRLKPDGEHKPKLHRSLAARWLQKRVPAVIVVWSRQFLQRYLISRLS